MDASKIKLYPNVIDHVTGTFTDYKGEDHIITVAAIDVSEQLAAVSSNEGAKCYGFLIGASICNPKDEYNEIIGINRAAKTALKNPKTLITGSYKGVLAENIVGSAVDNELEFVVNNINLYIKGYNESKAKYLEKHPVVSD